VIYDNWQPARIYLHAWQVTGSGFFRTIPEEILDYIVREMTYVGADANELQLRLGPKLPSSLRGVGTAAFYSTQEADSDGEEGKFLVWTPDEIRDVLDDGEDAFMAACGVTRHGNVEGKNIPESAGDMDQRPALAEARRKLHRTREQRIRPDVDGTAITSWSGLMLAAFAEAARTLKRDDHHQVAERNASLVLNELRQDNGRLLRAWKAHPERVLEGPGEGAGEVKLSSYLEDCSCLIDGLLEAYQNTFEARWLVTARELAEKILAHFRSPDGRFYDAGGDQEALITRPRDLHLRQCNTLRQWHGCHHPTEAGCLHQRPALCRLRRPAPGSDATHA
jgi:uncharacterized protein YyaL (SSP411 family)